MGLKGWSVIEFDDDAPYKVQATLDWGSVEEVTKAVESEVAQTVFGDIPNFSDKQPVVLKGPIIAKS